MLDHRRVRYHTVNRACAKRIGQIKDQLVDGNARAETEPKERVSTPVSRLRIVEESRPEGHYHLLHDPKVFCSQARCGGIIRHTIQHRSPFPRWRAVLDQ